MENRKSVINEWIRADKVDGSTTEYVFIHLLQLRSRLHIMCDILEEIACYRKSENRGMTNFEIENFMINLKAVCDLLREMIARLNKEAEEESK